MRSLLGKSSDFLLVYIFIFMFNRTGSNKANGYIFMYVHTPLWDQCNLKYKKINNDNNNIGDVTPPCDSSV